MRILNVQQMREADRRTIEDLGIPSLVLMEHAGRQVVAAMDAAIDGLDDAQVVVLCGRGNNGGDGCVVARALHQRGIDVRVCLTAAAEDVRGDAQVNLAIVGRLGVPIVQVTTKQEWERHRREVLGCDVLVDALFGTGLTTPLAGLFETIITDVNASHLAVVSIDLPSGLSADEASPIGPAIDATLTVALGALKLPLVVPAGERHAGSLVVADIGIPRSIIDGLDGPRLDLIARDDIRDLVPVREPSSHKGNCGHVLVVAGSPGKTGAAHLAAMAALRSGAGLVTVATPASSQPIVAAMGAEYMTRASAESTGGCLASHALHDVPAGLYDVIAAGPGIGIGPDQRDLVLGLIDQSSVPLVLDADALNVLAEVPGRLVARDGRLIIITPHPGEMARLVGATTAEVQQKRIDVARTFATDHGVFVILKGHRTVIATPDGRIFINPTGNPGMATGGSGDVLTGMVAGWLAQLHDGEAACKLAVYLHGAAGDLAATDVGEFALIASDIIGHLGPAVRALSAPTGDDQRSE